MEGRGLGTRGLSNAAVCIASELRAAKLESPFGKSYRQKVTAPDGRGARDEPATPEFDVPSMTGHRTMRHSAAMPLPRYTPLEHSFTALHSVSAT